MQKRFAVLMSVAVMLAFAFAGLTGCSANKGDSTVTLTPTVQSPAVIQDGYLTVGVNTPDLPFADESGGEVVGLDVDVAAAVAEKLGLELKLVNLSGEDADDALANKDVDMVMNLEKTAGAKTDAFKAAAYLYDGPALFKISPESESATVDITKLADTKIAAETGKLSAWTVQKLYPNSKTITTMTSLNSVFDALSSGEVTYAAAPLVAGSYCALFYDNARYVAMLATPEPVYIGVLATNKTLATAVASAVDTLEDTGVLKVILAKWLGSSTAEQALPSVASTVTVAATPVASTGTATGTTPAETSTTETTDTTTAE